MSDILSKNSEDPDALPLNERSTSFIDGVAFLEFVRLKSLADPVGGSAAKNGAACACVPGGEVATGAHGQDHDVSLPPTADPIDIKDWDILFAAVEERLRTTVEKPDLAAVALTGHDGAARIKAVVLDCVNALDKLHQALRQQRSA